MTEELQIIQISSIITTVIIVVIYLIFQDEIIKYLTSLLYKSKLKIAVDDYYKEVNANPFNCEIIKVLTIDNGYVQFQIIKSYIKFEIGEILTLWKPKFHNQYEYDSTFEGRIHNCIDNKITPVFEIDKYQVYTTDDKWYIIPKSENFDGDFSNYEYYGALSIALIEHNL